MATLAAAVVSLVCSCAFSNVCVHILGIQGLVCVCVCVCVCHAHTHELSRLQHVLLRHGQIWLFANWNNWEHFFVGYIPLLVAC